MMRRLLVFVFTAALTQSALSQQRIIVEGSDGNDIAGDVVVDSNGDVIVVGAYSQNIAFGEAGSEVPLEHVFSLDGFAVRYNAQGVAQSALRVHGPPQIILTEVDVDGDDNVFVAGTAGNNANFGEGAVTISAELGFGEGFLAKYGASDAFQWVRSFGVVGVNNMAASPSGAVFVAGTFQQSAQFPSISDTTRLTGNANTNIRTGFLAKYAATGALEWVNTFSNPLTSVGITALAVDDSGAYTCGSFISQDSTTIQTPAASQKIKAEGPGDAFVVKFDNLGEIIWLREEGSAAASENCSGIDVDQDGGVFITGNFFVADAEIGGSTVPLSDNNTYAASFDSNWNLNWVRALGFNIDEPLFLSDGSIALHADAGDNVLTMGIGVDGLVDYVLFEGGPNPERSGGIAEDPNDGSIWIAGSYATGQLDNGAVFGCGDSRQVVNGTQDVFLIQYTDRLCGTSTPIPTVAPNTAYQFDGGSDNGSITFTTTGTVSSATVSYTLGQVPDQSGQYEFLPVEFEVSVDGTGSAANITFPYGESDLLAFGGDASELGLFRNDSGTWTDVGASVNTFSRELTVTGESSYGSFAIGRVATPTGVEDVDAVGAFGELELYPNPTTARAAFEVAVESVDATVQVFDVLGRLQFAHPVAAVGQQRVELDFADLAKGVYIVRVADNRMQQVGTVVVR